MTLKQTAPQTAERQEDALDWWEWMRGLKTDHRNNTSQTRLHGQMEQMGKMNDCAPHNVSVSRKDSSLFLSLLFPHFLFSVRTASQLCLVNQDMGITIPNPAQSNFNYSSHERPLEEKLETTDPSSRKSLKTEKRCLGYQCSWYNEQNTTTVTFIQMYQFV